MPRGQSGAEIGSSSSSPLQLCLEFGGSATKTFSFNKIKLWWHSLSSYLKCTRTLHHYLCCIFQSGWCLQFSFSCNSIGCCFPSCLCFDCQLSLYQKIELIVAESLNEAAGVSYLQVHRKGYIRAREKSIFSNIGLRGNANAFYSSILSTLIPHGSVAMSSNDCICSQICLRSPWMSAKVCMPRTVRNVVAARRAVEPLRKWLVHETQTLVKRPMEIPIVLDISYSNVGSKNFIKDNCIYATRNGVFGQDLLCGNVVIDCPQVNTSVLINTWQDKEYTRSTCT